MSIRGYKIFKHNWTGYGGFQYVPGEVAKQDGPLILCKRGLHFCTSAIECLNYYNLDPRNKYAEVESIGPTVSDGIKVATTELKIVREIPYDEFREMCSGEITNYYHNGEKFSVTSYKNGYRHGPYKSYYFDGRLCIECFYENDKLHGMHIEYDFDSNLCKKSIYRNGKYSYIGSFYGLTKCIFGIIFDSIRDKLFWSSE